MPPNRRSSTGTSTSHATVCRCRRHAGTQRAGRLDDAGWRDPNLDETVSQGMRGLASWSEQSMNHAARRSGGAGGHGLARTRRHFFKDCGVGIGKIALASLLVERRVGGARRRDALIRRLALTDAPRSARTFRARPGGSSSCSWPVRPASSTSSTSSRRCGGSTASRFRPR